MLFDWWDKHYLQVAIYLFFLLLNLILFCIVAIWFQKALQEGEINDDAAANVNNIHLIGVYRGCAVVLAILAFADLFFIISQAK